MTAAYPGGNNTFVKDHEASGKMVVDFARNIKDFAVNQYTQIVPVKKTAGYYQVMTLEEAARVISSNAAEFVWYDGDDSPEGIGGTESFEYLPFLTKRYAPTARIGWLASEQATWDIIAQHSSIKSRQIMTWRTMRAISRLTDTTLYDATHTSAVSSISGNSGKWDISTTARADIKRSLNYAAEIILKDTLGAIDVNDLLIVMSPGCARKISESQEIIDHIKGTPDALDQIRGELRGRNAIFGLPDKLYGFPVVVEKTVRVSTKKRTTAATKAYVLGDTVPFMCSRPGGLVGVANAPSFSTCVLFMQEEMTVERKDDNDHRRTKVRVVENFEANLVAPVSGFAFTAAVAP